MDIAGSKPRGGTRQGALLPAALGCGGAPRQVGSGSASVGPAFVPLGRVTPYSGAL